LYDYWLIIVTSSLTKDMTGKVVVLHGLTSTHLYDCWLIIVTSSLTKDMTGKVV